jgi:hypothetical protein
VPRCRRLRSARGSLEGGASGSRSERTGSALADASATCAGALTAVITTGMLLAGRDFRLISAGPSGGAEAPWIARPMPSASKTPTSTKPALRATSAYGVAAARAGGGISCARGITGR